MYFGLNHYGWFTHIYDKKTGEDLLPEILNYVHDNYEELHMQREKAIRGPEDHWGIVFLHHLEMMHDFPYGLPSTYNLYYLYSGKEYAHYSLEHTRYDEVVNGREKNVFDYCRRITELGKLKGTEFYFSE